MMHAEGGKDHVKSGAEIRRRTAATCGDAPCFSSLTQEFSMRRGVISHRVGKLHKNKQCMTEGSQKRNESSREASLRADFLLLKMN